jgi:hypothetical protein
LKDLNLDTLSKSNIKQTLPFKSSKKGRWMQKYKNTNLLTNYWEMGALDTSSSFKGTGS